MLCSGSGEGGQEGSPWDWPSRERLREGGEAWQAHGRGRADPGGGLRDVTTQRLQDPGRTQARRMESAFPEHSWWPGRQQSLQGASGTFATAEMTVLQEERLDRDVPCCQLRKTTSQPPKKREQAAYVP